MSQPTRKRAEFSVNHHGGTTTDHHLVRDEVSKAAYRAGKSFELVSSCHISELRAELGALRERCARIAETEYRRGDTPRDLRGFDGYGGFTVAAERIARAIRADDRADGVGNRDQADFERRSQLRKFGGES